MKSKVDAPAVAAMPIAAILIQWWWNGYVVEPAMPEAVAIAAGAMVGAAVRWCLAWLPNPNK